MHDFPGDAVGKAIPHGIYDVASNDGFVSAGDHDTPVFAVKSIEAWWKQVGQARYPNVPELFIMADAGGSNSYRSHVWKQQLQRACQNFRVSGWKQSRWAAFPERGKKPNEEADT